MTYVVTEACIKCKYTDCVEVCPVDCFYEGENMLVIHPDECIDCGVCEPECPADAIKPDTEPGLEKWLEVNTEYAKTWPNITQKKDRAARRQGIRRPWKASSRNIFLRRRAAATDSKRFWLAMNEGRFGPPAAVGLTLIRVRSPKPPAGAPGQGVNH